MARTLDELKGKTEDLRPPLRWLFERIRPEFVHHSMATAVKAGGKHCPLYEALGAFRRFEILLSYFREAEVAGPKIPPSRLPATVTRLA